MSSNCKYLENQDINKVQIIEIATWKSGLSKPVLTCHEHNLKSVHVDYIYHKNEKGKPCEIDLSLMKNNIPNNLKPQKPVFYCRYMEFCLGNVTRCG